VLPLPLDLTASWKRGTAEGPAAIIAASHHIEFYDEELDAVCCELVGGIATHPTPELPPTRRRGGCDLRDRGAAVRADRLLLSLGGEHAVTAPLVRAHRALWPSLSVVQIDAHADLRTATWDRRTTTRCPMRRIVEDGVFLTGIGIRSARRAGAPLHPRRAEPPPPRAPGAGRLTDLADEIIAGVPPGDVYLTIDLDGFDPAVVRRSARRCRAASAGPRR